MRTALLRRLVREIVEGISVIISPDEHVHNEAGEYEWSPERAEAAWAKAYDELREALSRPETSRLVLMIGLPGAGKSTYLSSQEVPGTIYFDATLTNKAHRAPLIKMAHDAQVPVDALLINTPLEIAIARNNKRPENRRVPDAAMENMHNELNLEPPTRSEGFENVTVI